MGNIATTVEEQLEILRVRGMIFDEEEAKVKELLLDIGYYRLGFYWKPFEVDLMHNFKSGIKFSDVIKLHYLDVDLRNLLSRFINRIEINFRSNIIYTCSNAYKSNPIWYTDALLMKSNFTDNIDKFYNDKFKKNNKAIKRHHGKYTDTYAPAWKAIEFFTFGIVFNIYRNIKNRDIKLKICRDFGMESIRKFENLMNSVVLIRNSCAHGDRLFDFNTPQGLSKIPVISFNHNNRNSLDSCIKVISFFLGHISENRKNELDMEIKDLFDSHKSNPVIKEIIINSINFCY